jgi:hypothetical protein
MRLTYDCSLWSDETVVEHGEAALAALTETSANVTASAQVIVFRLIDPFAPVPKRPSALPTNTENVGAVCGKLCSEMV